MKKYFTYLKTVLLLLVVGFILGFASKRNARRPIQEDVHISFGNQEHLFITHAMVNNLLIQNGKHVVNQSKTLINLQELEAKVQAHPMVSEAQVSVGVIGDLEVNVQQRRPLARIYNATETAYIDTKGKKMPLSNNYSARVPILYNSNGWINVDEIFPLLQKIDSDDFLKKIIVSIQKDKEGYWLESRYQQQKIKIGGLEKLHQKFKKLKVFYAYMEKDSLASTFKTIDIKYNNQVVCSK